MNRRGFLGSILALAAAPAIVRADSLMRVVPIETITVSLPNWWLGLGENDAELMWHMRRADQWAKEVSGIHYARANPALVIEREWSQVNPFMLGAGRVNTYTGARLLNEST